jgi:hypothetical protein
MAIQIDLHLQIEAELRAPAEESGAVSDGVSTCGRRVESEKAKDYDRPLDLSSSMLSSRVVRG